MKNLRKIVSISIMAFIGLTTTSAINAQELVKKHGSIKEQIETSPLFNDGVNVKEILDFASKFKGVRYRYGSSSPKGFDCSGFTSYVFSNFGFDLSRSSRTQIKDGEKVAKKEELKPGDLIFFNGRSVGKRIGHVGIVTEVDANKGDVKFIHSSTSSGVIVSSINEPYYKKRFVGGSRVLPKNPEVTVTE